MAAHNDLGAWGEAYVAHLLRQAGGRVTARTAHPELFVIPAGRWAPYHGALELIADLMKPLGHGGVQ
jgi:hypothetical protein